MEYPQSLLNVIHAFTASSIGVLFAHGFNVYLRNKVEYAIDPKSKELFKGNYRRAHAYLTIEDNLALQYKGFKAYWARNFFGLFFTLLIA